MGVYIPERQHAKCQKQITRQFFLMQKLVILALTSVTGYFATRPAFDPCDALCLTDTVCAAAKYNSYCKLTQTPQTCFGLYRDATRPSGVCFQPEDPTCDDLVLAPVLCSEVGAGGATTVPPVV